MVNLIITTWYQNHKFLNLISDSKEASTHIRKQQRQSLKYADNLNAQASVSYPIRQPDRLSSPPHPHNERITTLSEPH